MIVYHIGHLGMLPVCIAHKLFFHREEQTVFLIDKVMIPKHTSEYFEGNLEKFSWIGKIVTYNEWIFVKIPEEKQLEDKITTFFDKLLLDNNIDTNKVQMFYNTFDAWNAFGVYLRLKKYPFSIMELFPRQLKIDRYGLTKRPVYDSVIKKHQALSAIGETLIKTIYRSYKETTINLHDNFISINYADLISCISPSDRMNILNSYSLDQEVLKLEHATLLNMSSGLIRNVLNPPTVEQWILLYQLYADYFMLNSSDKMIIKPHPNYSFPLDFYRKHFPETIALPGHFPSNFIQLIPNLKISKIFGMASAVSDNAFNSKFYKIINVGPYRPLYYLLHKFHVAFCLIKRLGFNKLYHFGIQNGLAKNGFIECLEEIWGIGKSKLVDLKNIDNNSIFIIDDVLANGEENKKYLDEAIKNSDNFNVFVFLNSKNDYCFLSPNNPEIINNIIPITIEKTATREDINSDLNSEILYVFCKSQEVRQKILNFSLHQKLANTGIEISVKPIDQEEIDKNNKDLSLKLSESLKSERNKQ